MTQHPMTLDKRKGLVRKLRAVRELSEAGAADARDRIDELEALDGWDSGDASDHKRADELLADAEERAELAGALIEMLETGAEFGDRDRQYLEYVITGCVPSE